MQKKDKVTIGLLLAIMVIVLVCGTKITLDCYHNDKIANCALDLDRQFRTENPQLVEVPRSVSEYNYATCRATYGD